MANATATVPDFTVAWGDDKITRGNDTVATAITFYPGVMTALTVNGLVVIAQDSPGLKFDGIYPGGQPVTVSPGDASASLNPPLQSERPFRFGMAIASAVQGDEGKAVYVVDDAHVGYTSTNLIRVGYVDKVLTSTLVLIRPDYGGQVSITTATTLTVSGAATIGQGLNVGGNSSIGAGGAGGYGLTISNSSVAPGIYVGSGAPTISVGISSLYIRTDGSASTRLYSATSGTGGWTGFASL